MMIRVQQILLILILTLFLVPLLAQPVVVITPEGTKVCEDAGGGVVFCP